MRNKLLIILAALSLALSSCGTTERVVVKDVHHVVMPDKQYLQCKQVPLPNPDTLTDAQVALLINDLITENKICANNMAAVDEFLSKAKERLEKAE